MKAYYSREPGAVLSTAINKYMYLTVKERFGDSFRVSYSRTELADSPEQIEHPIVRTCLQQLNIRQGLEIVSVADLPAQSGMGSSSSFTVGLLNALHALQCRCVAATEIAEQACHVEIEQLREPIGKQDQYIAACGGLQFIQFFPDGRVSVNPVVCSLQTRQQLNRRLLLFYTGLTRNARDVLQKQQGGTAHKLPALRRLCRIAEEMRDTLTRGHDLPHFGNLLHEGWTIKKTLEASISNGRINDLYERGIRAGALGGKLLGAGMGGFLLFYCEPERQDDLRVSLADLQEVPFSFEPEGRKIIFIDIPSGNPWSSLREPIRPFELTRVAS